MKCEQIMQVLEEHSPLFYACDWDNVGLLVGDREKEVERVYIALDATDEVIEEAIERNADMILTHHPMIFKGMKRVNTDYFIGQRIIKLIQNDIAYYAMHTNFDVKGMADLSAAMIGLEDSRVLEVTHVIEEKEEGIGRVGNFMKPMSLRSCAKFVRTAFSLEQVKVFGDADRKIKRAAISPGSGKSEISHAIAANADVLITGDIDHHDGIDAVAQGLCIIDAGHYGLEHIFISYMKEYLEKKCTGLEVFTQKITFPFWVI